MTSDKDGPQRKKLLVLTSTFPRWPGDHEPPFVFELCRRLGEDFEVWVLAPHAPDTKTHETMSGVTVVRFCYFFEWGETLAYRGGILANLRGNRLRYLLVPLFLVCQLLAVLRLLAREKFDIVHAHWLIPQGLVAVAARLISGRVPALLCTAHGSDLLGLRGALFSALKRLVMHRSDAVTVVSLAMKERAASLDIKPDKITVIPMGVDTANDFVPGGQASRRNHELLFVGRLVSSKAVDILIGAMPAILAEYPEATLTIAGDGPEKGWLETLAQTLGVAGRVSFLGAVANPALPELYRRAAIFVSASQEEGFGLTLVEALACGCAVIAADLPAIRDVIIHQDTGLLVAQQDPEAFAGAVVKLLAEPDVRRQLAVNGRNHVARNFDWAEISSRYAAAFERLILERA
ncbi:MAG: hypothetical protein A3F73_03675 [Gallionellales bacterium RIFCSPLOWO2_12_FULL_59_22]|nr:MAG: hypothetical protein A3H99_00995 [Gallionellales bacterium RIFCSPLOWO2_02_FULL_59_110]OGT01435.1 MAG: hypothetical protein A2Z65_13795 [Gallionellales bacterium RIFCSPLOWO2_02_58_13]OGT14486.1 MAG: hypothetical protein A3F73_03675 [Gallionellales bacterium RIFCSPLOWO2_12_FULL_59_22]